MNAIILSVEITFTEWLQSAIDERGWTWNKLAKKAGLSSGTIYNIRDGTRGVGEDSLQAIAKALNIPSEEVYRAAGILPIVSVDETDLARFKDILSQLTAAERAELAAIGMLKINARREAELRQQVNRKDK